VSAVEWSVRSIRRTRRDRDRLASFSCADPGIDWQVEVEDFVRNELYEWRYAALAQADDSRVLLVFRDEELIGVVAHERIHLQHQEEAFVATKLEVVALARRWQGRRFASGERASDVLLSAVMTDVASRVPPRFARVLAVIHEANVRSIEVCKRHGFTEELSRSDQLRSYRRLVTEHKPFRSPGKIGRRRRSGEQ
jgi:RimJ/RimL family protein N-acetyltransferase